MLISIQLTQNWCGSCWKILKWYLIHSQRYGSYDEMLLWETGRNYACAFKFAHASICHCTLILLGHTHSNLLQVNLCQKYSFLNQLTHYMTTDCSLIYDFSTRKIQVQNMLCTKIVFCFGIQNNFCTQHVLNLYFSCTEVVNQWTICRHIVG